MGLYRDETGRLMELDDAFAQARGYEPAHPLELEAINAAAGESARGEERGVVGDINAAATGFASGLTLGGSDYLLGKTLSPLERERVQAEIAAHPTLRMGGEIAGTFAGMVPGLGATPAGYLSNLAGQAVERGVARGGAAGYGTALAAMGTEGAGQSVGQYIGHSALADKELTAEGLTGAAGVGFAFGAGGGGAALGVVKGTVAARRMFSRVMAGERAAADAESAWSLASQEALDVDAANARSLEIKQENIRQAKIAAQREVNASRAAIDEEKAARIPVEPEAVAPELPVGPEPLADVAPAQGGMPTSVFKRPAPAEGPEPLIDVGEQPGGAVTAVRQKPVEPPVAEASAPTVLEQQLAGTKAKLDDGTPFREVNEGAVPGSPVSPQIPPGKAAPHQPGRKQGSSSINDWLAEKAAFDADELSQVNKLEDLRGARDMRNRRQETLREIRFKKTEELLGTAVAKEEQRIAEALDAYTSARQELEGLSGFGPESNGVPESIGRVELPTKRLGTGDRQAAAILDDAHEEALLRAKTAIDPAEGGQAIQEAHELERLLEELSSPRSLQKGDNALSARDLRSPKAEQWLDQMKADIDKVKRYEDASAKLADEAGDQAHPRSLDRTKAMRAAEKDSERKVFERTARAADDADFVGPPEPSPKQRLSRAKGNLAELKVQGQEIAHEVRQANKKVKVGEAAKAEALAADAKAAKAMTLGGAAAETGGLIEFMDIPGMPKPSDLPIVGPLLGIYLKYRTAKGTLNRIMGRTAATADAKAAVMAAQTRDRIARAVDRSLGAVERVAKTGTKTMPKIAGVLASRVYDDGQPDAKKGASLPELAAVRMREIASYVSTPGAIERDVRRELAGITDPDLISATEKQRRIAMEFLLSKMPKLPEPGLLDGGKQMLPSPLQALQLGRRMEAIHDPPGLFERLAQEQDLLSLEAAEALRAVYPKLFSEAQQRVLETVTSAPRSVPIRARIQLSLLYKLPLDASLDPDNLKITQSVFDRKVQQPAMPQQAAPPNPAIANPVNVSQALTPTLDRR